jgi:hypothetical protein
MREREKKEVVEEEEVEEEEEEEEEKPEGLKSEGHYSTDFLNANKAKNDLFLPHPPPCFAFYGVIQASVMRCSNQQESRLFFSTHSLLCEALGCRGII